MLRILAAIALSLALIGCDKTESAKVAATPVIKAEKKAFDVQYFRKILIRVVNKSGFSRTNTSAIKAISGRSSDREIKQVYDSACAAKPKGDAAMKKAIADRLKELVAARGYDITPFVEDLIADMTTAYFGAVKQVGCLK